MENNRDVIIACNFENREKLFEFLKPFHEQKLYPFLKIGMELFYKEGSDLLYSLDFYNHKIFLDLKLFDIPTTVRKATDILPLHLVDIFTIHSMGGTKMMKDVQKSIEKEKLAAVTLLTSVGEEDFDVLPLKWGKIDKNSVIYCLAYDVVQSGINTIICSAQDIEIFKKTGLDGKLKFICPGIRFKGDGVDDQERVCTPEEAKELGTDYIVVGRSITKSNNPVEKYELCRKLFL